MSLAADMDWRSLRPAFEPPAWLRRASPILAAAGLHIVALWLLVWLAPPGVMAPPAPRAIDVTLFTPVESAPVIADITEPAQTAPVDAPPVETAPEHAAPEPQTSDAPPAAAPTDRVSAPVDTSAGVVLDAEGGTPDETALPTRSSALRGLACARGFGSDLEMTGCGEADAMDFSRFASGEAAARVERAVDARFNALFGLYGAQLDPALRRLPGQQGMQVMDTRRMGMSGADEMRETLPALVPDPAFDD